MDTNTNAAIISALTAAVLANASDYDVTCEISRRGLNLDIASLSDEALKDEVRKRGLVSDDPAQALRDLAAQGLLSVDAITSATGISQSDLLGQIEEDLKEDWAHKWVGNNPLDVMDHLDDSCKEDWAREWVANYPSDAFEDVCRSDKRDLALEWLDEHERKAMIQSLSAEDLAALLDPHQMAYLIVELANRAKF